MTFCARLSLLREIHAAGLIQFGYVEQWNRASCFFSPVKMATRAAAQALIAANHRSAKQASQKEVGNVTNWQRARSDKVSLCFQR